jgi:hypothetical protein
MRSAFLQHRPLAAADPPPLRDLALLGYFEKRSISAAIICSGVFAILSARGFDKYIAPLRPPPENLRRCNHSRILQ